ncbi:N-acetyltransferase family protein [Agromyces soli]
MAAYDVRPAGPSDGAFLADMTVEAANWRAGGTRPRPAVLADPAYRAYVAGWQRPSDRGVVAVGTSGEAIGAAWFRLFAPDSPAHGFVAAGVPELVIGVLAPWRAQGVGRTLLRRLCGAARGAGHARIALSVEHGNFAAALYRSEGFAVVASEAGRDTMVRALR